VFLDKTRAAAGLPLGCADDRATLVAPVDGRLFFAGEACSRADFSTAHGAYLTGLAAAEQAIEALRR
jgi:monoamine oxidase